MVISYLSVDLISDFQKIDLIHYCACYLCVMQKQFVYNNNCLPRSQ